MRSHSRQEKNPAHGAPGPTKLFETEVYPTWRPMSGALPIILKAITYLLGKRHRLARRNDTCIIPLPLFDAMNFCPMVDGLLRLHTSHVQQMRLYRLNLDVFDRNLRCHLAAASPRSQGHCHITHVTTCVLGGSLATLLPFSASGKFVCIAMRGCATRNFARK